MPNGFSQCPTSYLTSLYYKDAEGAYVEVAKVISIRAPGSTINIIPRPYLKTPSAHLEKCVGLVDAGELSFDVEYVAAQHADLVTLHQDRTARDWKVVLPDTGNLVMHAVIKTFPLHPEIPEDGRLQNTVTLAISGKPVWTEGV